MKSILNRLSLSILLTALTVPAISTLDDSASQMKRKTIVVEEGSTLYSLHILLHFINKITPQFITRAELDLFQFPDAKKAINAALKEGRTVRATVKITPEKTSFTATVKLDIPKSPIYTFKSIKNPSKVLYGIPTNPTDTSFENKRIGGKTISPADFNYAYSSINALIFMNPSLGQNYGLIQGPIYQGEYHLIIYPKMIAPTAKHRPTAKK